MRLLIHLCAVLGFLLAGPAAAQEFLITNIASSANDVVLSWGHVTNRYILETNLRGISTRRTGEMSSR